MTKKSHENSLFKKSRNLKTSGILEKINLGEPLNIVVHSNLGLKKKPAYLCTHFCE